MLKVDRLGWAEGLTFFWHGIRIGVRVNDPAMMDELKPSLPPAYELVEDNMADIMFSLWSATESRKGVRGFHMGFCDHQIVERSLELDSVVRSLRLSLESYLAITAKRKTFVRAGVVGWQGGALIILGGETTGTSTLVRSLVEKGAEYWSDRFAVLDSKGRVHPYPVPALCGKEEARPALDINTAASRSGKTKGPLTTRAIILTEYRPGANWRPRRMTPAQAVIAMLQRTPSAHSKPDTALGALSNAAEGAVSITSKRGEAETAASDILKRFS